MSDQGVLEITDEWITEIYDEMVETIKTWSPAREEGPRQAADRPG